MTNDLQDKTTEATDTPENAVEATAGAPKDWRKWVRVLVALIVVVLVVAVAIIGYLFIDRDSELNSMHSRIDNDHRATKASLDYATGAANMDYRDLPSWNKRLTTNTSPELSTKLTQAASSMEQVITPLQWTSTSAPIAAVVKSESGGVYVVTAFVSVLTKNAEAPDGVQSTATYTVTVDSKKNWLITDVGGVGGAVSNATQHPN